MRMTSPRGTYGGGYYTSPFFPDTPIYDNLVKERGTPQIAPIRVSSAYESGSNLPALPSGPSAPSYQAYQAPAQGPAQGGPYNGGYPHPGSQQSLPLQNAPAPYIPQPGTPRPAFNGNGTNGAGYPMQQGGAPFPYQGPTGYEPVRPPAPRPPAPRPAAPGGYGQDQYRRNLGPVPPPAQPGMGGYYQGG
jgi:hypothetical protein